MPRTERYHAVQLVRWGNSPALLIPAAYAKDLNMPEEAPADLVIEKDRLVSTPLPQTSIYCLDDLLADITDQNIHGEVPTGTAVGEEFQVKALLKIS